MKNSRRTDVPLSPPRDSDVAHRRIEAMNAAYAARSEAAIADDDAELRAWDTALLDGLENE